MTASFLERQQRQAAHDRREREGRFRLTAQPPEDFERLLTCTRCSAVERVFEAAMGARTPAEHQWIDPAEFICLTCLEKGAK